ncbi:MAG TPA: radical SAM/SPASM domain-containing protein [Candidatus Dormibacteraeota bacterium]|nr:radical SAM/SPASM domain-containing protein [Candidatus Dormibacteraeota bacterium]
MPIEEIEPLRFVWCELTSLCNLACRHCYADSGPYGNHGTMTVLDWCCVLEEAAALGALDVQFIGGEPTLHPGLPALVRHALGLGLQVEVFSNLVKVREPLWETFQLPGVRLATSYYSPDPSEHDMVTGRHSHDQTLANIREAVQRNIPLRVGVIQVEDRQRARGAVDELKALGVAKVDFDVRRAVGRSARGMAPDVGQLCGHCADGSLAVSPNGEVWPCVFSRWLIIGNARECSLAELHVRAQPARTELASAFADRISRRCSPDDGGCTPAPCEPIITCSPQKGSSIAGAAQ